MSPPIDEQLELFPEYIEEYHGDNLLEDGEMRYTPGDKQDLSIDSDPLYRKDMIDAGRGRQLR